MRPEDIFTPEQLAALRAAGYAVYFLRAERLLGLEVTP